MKQTTAERYLANFFYQYFCEFFENSCSASKKKPSESFFYQVDKKHPWRSLILVKYRLLQKQPLEVFCKNRFAKFTGKHLCQRLYFNKVADLRL